MSRKKKLAAGLEGPFSTSTTPSPYRRGRPEPPPGPLDTLSRIQGLLAGMQGNNGGQALIRELTPRQ